ncbi:MAG: hypothetical protein QM831_09830 [Kofleriaceae bacterium]
MSKVWRRENYTVGGGPGVIALIVLAPERLPDPLPISRTQHGIPTDTEHTDVELVARGRTDDPAWFEQEVVGPFADLIATDLGPDVAATALASEHVYIITGEVDDPEDLGHIQTAWAIAKCICELGGTLVIDVYAARAHLGVEIAALAPDRAFDLMHEITLFFDEDDHDTLSAWSLGLVKFGRPEIVLVDVPPDQATETALIMRDIANTLAVGERVEPGDGLGLPDGSRLVASQWDPATSPIVSVEGAALLLSR